MTFEEYLKENIKIEPYYFKDDSENNTFNHKEFTRIEVLSSFKNKSVGFVETFLDLDEDFEYGWTKVHISIKIGISHRDRLIDEIMKYCEKYFLEKSKNRIRFLNGMKKLYFI